jgi:hypothetical protein
MFHFTLNGGWCLLEQSGKAMLCACCSQLFMVLTFAWFPLLCVCSMFVCILLISIFWLIFRENQ